MKQAYIDLSYSLMVYQEKNETVEEFRLRMEKEVDELCEKIKEATGLEVTEIGIDIMGE